MASKVPPSGEGSPTAATFVIVFVAARYRNRPRGEWPPSTSQRNSTSPASLIAGAKGHPRKKPLKVPPIGDGSPHPAPGSPEPPPLPQPMAMALTPDESATKTP